jgi:glucose-6-phosphate-specific signal transduction histidine kinase
MNQTDNPALAGDILNWYQGKLGEITGLIQPTLIVVALFFVIVSYAMFRSWKKAVIAGIGGAIVLAVVAQITGISSKVQSEINSSPRPAVVLHVGEPVR